MMEQPPVIPAAAASPSRGGVGQVGLYLSLAAVAMVALLMLGKPG